MPNGQVRVFDPPKSRKWKEGAKPYLLDGMGGRPPYPGPIECRIVACFSCPKGDERKRDPRPARPHSKRPDAENVAKAVLDAATGIVWVDDSQVYRLFIEKRIAAQGDAPFVSVEVWEVE